MKLFKSILLCLLLWGSFFSYGQSESSKFKTLFQDKDKELHFGVRTFYLILAEMAMIFAEGQDMYLANEKNETIKFDYNFSFEFSSNTPVFPSIYARYNWGNHLFAELDLFGFWFTNSISFENSVDASEYYGVYSEYNDDLADFGYNKYDVNWAFMGNSLHVGASFLKTKAIQPYVSGGFTLLYLMNFGPDLFGEERQNRANRVFSNLDTFKKVSFYPSFSAGLKYRGISLGYFRIFPVTGMLKIIPDFG